MNAGCDSQQINSSMAKIINRKIKHANMAQRPTEAIICIDFEDDLFFLTMSDVEEDIESFYSMREKLRREKRLREEHETLQLMWDEYQMMLKLLR